MRFKHVSSTQLQGYRSRRMKDMIIEKIAETPADACVVGGDFHGHLINSIRELAPIAERMPVVYVPGNIDFYTGDYTMEELLEQANELADKMGNVHLLSNSSVVLGDTRFIGATLWTDVSGASRKEVHAINDFRSIRTFEGPWTTARQKIEHDVTVDFLESELAIRDGLATVVVTHNSPHPSVRDPQYPGASPFFYSDLSYLLGGPFAPDYWIVGGNHVTMDWKIGETLLVSNGLGHPREADVGENFEHFDFDAVLETSPKPSPRLTHGSAAKP